MKKFALLGSAGYIAPRHIQAINDNGHKLVCAHDPNDSVGILDRFSHDVQFFSNFEEFDIFIEELKQKGEHIDYLSICSPNYLHHTHIKYGLKNGMNVICEKPLVLNQKEIDEIAEYEKRYNKKVYSVLQLREHDAIVKLKNKIEKSNQDQKYEIELTYITTRGPWYYKSWKGNHSLSGGLMSNIGIHFFDMLSWIFGEVKNTKLYTRDEEKASGFLELENAKVKWFLAIDKNSLPAKVREEGKNTFRSLKINDDEFEFSKGFTELHTKLYQKILDGSGYGLNEAKSSIELVQNLRTASLSSLNENSHPFIRNS